MNTTEKALLFGFSLFIFGEIVANFINFDLGFLSSLLSIFFIYYAFYRLTSDKEETKKCMKEISQKK